MFLFFFFFVLGLFLVWWLNWMYLDGDGWICINVFVAVFWICYWLFGGWLVDEGGRERGGIFFGICVWFYYWNIRACQSYTLIDWIFVFALSVWVFWIFLGLVGVEIMEKYVFCGANRREGRKFVVLGVWFGCWKLWIYHSVEWLIVLAFQVWVFGLVHAWVLFHWVPSCENPMIYWPFGCWKDCGKRERRKENF